MNLKKENKELRKTIRVYSIQLTRNRTKANNRLATLHLMRRKLLHIKQHIKKTLKELEYHVYNEKRN